VRGQGADAGLNLSGIHTVMGRCQKDKQMQLKARLNTLLVQCISSTPLCAEA
jgi:hypothetical protein